MTKKELLKRIEELEWRVRQLEARPFIKPTIPGPYRPWQSKPFTPWNPYSATWC